jgi:hypothetical protein
MAYIIVVSYEGRNEDIGEGPWDDFEEAERYAYNEVGYPWVIVEVSDNYAADRSAIARPREWRGDFHDPHG